MKTWLPIVLGTVVGMGSPLATGGAERQPWLSQTAQERGKTDTPAAPRPLRPVVKIDQETHDFGLVEGNVRLRHEFLVTNVGKAPLEVSKGRAGCKCTATILREGEIAPGESTKVAVALTRGDRPGPFTHTVILLTNDPTRPRLTLTVKGRVVAGARAVPSELIFSRIARGSDASAKVRVFGYEPQPLEITGYELANPATAHHFVVAFEPLTPEQLEREKEQDATSGWLVTVAVKSGLPMGAFQQKVRLLTSSQKRTEIEIPVRGAVGREIWIMGHGWNKETGVLTMGRVKSRIGAKRTLTILAGGSHHQQLKLEPVRVVPSVLQVELGKTAQLQRERVSLTPLTIRVPKGTRPMDHLGSSDGSPPGLITIQTGHPKMPELRILVRFSVED